PAVAGTRRRQHMALQFGRGRPLPAPALPRLSRTPRGAAQPHERGNRTMSIWYYADADHVRQGPVDAASLVRLRLQGRLGWDTLVWREGMAEWRPMREFAGEL